MVCDFPQFTSPSFSLGVYQEEKHALPKGVVPVNWEPDIPTIELQVLNYDLEDILTRAIMSSANYSSTPLSPCTSSPSLIAKFLLLFDRSKCLHGFAYF